MDQEFRMNAEEENNKTPQPPGAPDSEPIKEPSKKAPMGDPNSPGEDEPRLGTEADPTRPNTTEINPAKPGNETEVDLDKSKTKTYPEKSA